MLSCEVRRDSFKIVADVICRKGTSEMPSNVASEFPVPTTKQDAREETFPTKSVECDDGVDVLEETLQLRGMRRINVV